MPALRKKSRKRAHSASVSARVSGQSYMGKAAMNSLMPAIVMQKCELLGKLAMPQNHSFGGSAGTGAVPSPETLRARTRGRKARPGSGARRSAGCTTGSLALKAYSFSSAK